MEVLSACLYCKKKKECLESVTAHSFLDSCFVTENEAIRAAVEHFRELSTVVLPFEIYDKVNSIIGIIIAQQKKIEKAAHYLCLDNCELVCIHGGDPCVKETECFCCDEPCICRDCKDSEKFEIDWSKLDET